MKGLIIMLAVGAFLILSLEKCEKDAYDKGFQTGYEKAQYDNGW
jgi:hypothetical protein